MSRLLEVRSLEVAYGPVRALHGVDLHVDEGEIVTLIGANGAGKTTLLRAISGLERPRSGTIHFAGERIDGLPPHRVVERGLCHCPEGRGIFANLTVDENLDLGAWLRRGAAGRAADERRIRELLPVLAERGKQAAGTLSGGEQQMLAIGRALLGRPKLLLLDEPSLGLAPQVVRKVMDLVVTIAAEGTTVLLVEQNAHLALQIARRAYVLETGRVVREGLSAEVAADPAVVDAYLGGSASAA